MSAIQVIKIGGNIVDNPEALESFLDDFAALNGPKVLVHGGGKIATKVSAALGIEAQMVEGRRVTDEETLKVVTMVYAGLVNKTIVSKLQARGVDALGLSGADANVIKSHKRIPKGVDYGFVADVDEVRSDFLISLINQGVTPIMAPITHDKAGLLLNTNADTVASAVACGLGKEQETVLSYCFELPGVMRNIEDENSVINEITPAYYGELKAEGVVKDGMIPKIDNCMAALEEGVSAVRICQASDLTSIINEGGTKGTTFHK